MADNIMEVKAMKKKVIIAVLLCVLVGAVVAIFLFVKNDSEKSSVSSAELITDPEKIKNLIDNCIEENGYKYGVRVEIQDSNRWIHDEPNHDIVIVGLFIRYKNRSKIENWDEYLGGIREKVLECISDNNIDKNYVIIDQTE